MPERFFTGFILEAYVYVTTAAQKEAAETMGKSSQYKIGFVYRLFSCSFPAISIINFSRNSNDFIN